MKFIITGRKIDVTEGLKERIYKKLGKLEKFFDTNTEANVTLEVEKGRHIIEVTIPYENIILRAEEYGHDMYSCIDRVVDVIERQIRKNKTRLEKRLKENAFLNYDEEGFEEDVFKVVKSKKFAIKPMDVEEAILQMNLIGHQFYMFSNADTDEVNVVYRRRDGDYGLIEPEF